MDGKIAGPGARSERRDRCRSNAGRWLHAMGVAVITAAIVFRIYHLILPPWAGDAVRHLHYAEAVLQFGPKVAALTATQINSSWRWTTVWPDSVYIYPPLVFLFFIPIAAIWPTVFAVKLVLTLMEGINAWLCWKITGKRWIGVLYFVCPISIWYASRDAQYEPFQNLLALLALYFLPTSAPLALGLLVLAIQTKITSGALLPLFLWRIFRQQSAIRDRAFIVAAIACLPGLIALRYYPWVSNLAIKWVPMNTYYWNPWNARCAGASAPELVLHQFVSYALLVILLVGVARSNYRMAYAGPLIFIIFIKTCANMNGWYLMMWVPLVLPIREKRIRAACLLLWPIMNFQALVLGLTTMAQQPSIDMVRRGLLSAFQRV